MMHFYIIQNGYLGDSYVRVYVIADSDERALELAGKRYYEDAHNETSTYPEKYWTNLHIERKIPANREYASKVDD